MHNFLTQWAIQYNIPQKGLIQLLKGLRQHSNFNLPNDPRTILKTPQSAEPISICGGTYCHIGVRKSIMCYLAAIAKSQEKSLPENITLDFNIDEVSCSRSSQIVLWLIQLYIRESGCDPFVIGVFSGKEKPECNLFLKQFVDELIALKSDGVIFNDTFVFVNIGYFSCDTPAVSFIRGSKGHTGFNSCVKCTQRGLYLDNRLVFPHITKADRTDESFRSRSDPNHHIKKSILESIDDFDMIRSFPVDEMHIVHLGVVKKLIGFWNKSLTKVEKNLMEARVNSVEMTRPFEIRRQIRNLSAISQFKAKECRIFLHFTGPVIMKDILDEKRYKHFLLLHFSMRKMIDKRFLGEIQSIRGLIEKFVHEFKELYGLNQLTYVVHSLLHISDDVVEYGVPRNFSAYKFENNNGKIIKNIRRKNQIAQQVHNRAVENLNVFSIPRRDASLKLEKSVSKKLNECNETIFKQITFKGLRFDSSVRNKWFFTNNHEICAFKYAKESKIIACQKITSSLNNFYDYPSESKDINVFFVEENYLSEDMNVHATSIECKMFFISSNDGLVFFPISNTDD